MAGAALLLVGAVSGWLVWPRPAPPPIATPASPGSATARAFRVETADEQRIRDHVSPGLTIFNFAANPRILVLDFASLLEQGRTLDRVAAFVEKAGLPHDRVLTDDELDAAIRATGDTVETFYYGHDYPSSALVRFFASADAQHVELNRQEETLRALLRQEGWFAPGVAGALISLPSVGADDKVTPAVRAGILRHELSHGEFFSDPTYAAYVHDFWLSALSEPERAAMRGFLAKDGYDAGEEELMYNEMQAYLMFTRERSMFAPSMIGMSESRLKDLQRAFLAGMPAGWLRAVMAAYPDQVSAQQ